MKGEEGKAAKRQNGNQARIDGEFGAGPQEGATAVQSIGYFLQLSGARERSLSQIINKF